MFSKIKAIKDLRAQGKKLQSSLAQILASGSGSWGKVKLSVNGNQEMLSIEIADELLSDKQKLQEAIKEAHADAMKKLHREMALKMKDLGGLDALKQLGA